MEALLLESCLEEIFCRFAPNQRVPSLRVETCPGLTKLAGDLFGVQGEATDHDINKLVFCFVRFYEISLDDREEKARARAALAFMFCHYTPNERDYFLIKRGNPRLKGTSTDTKQVRDTWAFMTYKRTLMFDAEESYTAKPGQTMRTSFKEALLRAVRHSFEQSEAFREEASKMQQELSSARLLMVPKPLGPSENTVFEDGKVDVSQFISETIPDGSIFPFGATFIKTWTIKNAGNVPWINRSVKRMVPNTPTMPYTQELIPVPTTFPGEFATVSVEVTTSRYPSFAEIRFKMVDERGELCFPHYHPYGLVLSIETQHLMWDDR
ncbi:NBR1-Ig-like domain-containing protein [Psychromicrobium sp. YIM B11713]|uniref:NBR1-Ig-like domain-containing protein n=1 Tax=Psychromicrobium sp. YIM B11713 TaxID=3145233 RepID=UPI00374F9E12